MDFTLKRTQFRADGIFGQMTSEDGSCVLETLEHAFQVSAGSWQPAIPAGVYACERRVSPKFGYDLFIILDVPGHDFIEIHVGNLNADSSGCILLGMGLATYSKGQMITDSRNAFEEFMSLEEGLNRFNLSIVNP